MQRQSPMWEKLVIIHAVLIMSLLAACSPEPARFPTVPPPAPTLTPTPTTTPTPTPQPLARHTEDLPDDLTGKQVRILYLVPSDGLDRNLDTNGVLNTSVGAWQKWLAER